MTYPATPTYWTSDEDLNIAGEHFDTNTFPSSSTTYGAYTNMDELQTWGGVSTQADLGENHYADSTFSFENLDAPYAATDQHYAGPSVPISGRYRGVGVNDIIVWLNIECFFFVAT